MPRGPRLVDPEGTYHLTANATGSESLFLTDRDATQFLGLLDRVVERYRWNCLAYCLMSTHYHLIVETPHGELDRGMHRLNACYAQWFNWRRARAGHLFAERFHSELVMTEEHMLGAVRYVALNPVEAGLCAAPQNWRWSSYAAAAGLERPPAFLATDALLVHFGRTRAVARNRLRAFVENA
jgi:putative transposase